jgi:hypothetical protein
MPERNFVGGSPREGKRQGKHGGDLDAQSVTELDMIPSGKACTSLSDVGGLCPPSPVRVNHVEHISP